MPIFLTSLLGLLGNIPGMIGDYFKTKQQIQLAQIQLEQQVQLANINAASKGAEADSDRAIAIINAKASWVRIFAFLLVAFPFLCCLVNRPEYAQMVFANLSSLPDWYALLFAGVVGNMWGIPVPGTFMGSIAQGIQSAVHNTRSYKLAKNGIDPQVYFNALRTSKGGKLSQSDVDSGNKVLEELNKDQ